VLFQGGLDRRTQILSAPGVAAIVGWSGRPAIIPQEEIDMVRRLVENAVRVEPQSYPQCGERIRIKEGALQGIEGVLVRIKNQFRLVVSLEMLGRSAAVEVDMSTIERLGPAHEAPAPRHMPACI
jgi:transcription antitermination factor NusG